MTDSPTGGLSTSRDTRHWSTHTDDPPPDHREQPTHFFSASNSMRRPASASRTYGRYAVALRADP